VATVRVQKQAAFFVKMVQRERRRQDAKWGPQNHSLDEWGTILAEEFGSFAKTVNNFRMSDTPAKNGECYLRVVEELTHTAAVAQAIYEQYFSPTLDS